MKSIAAFLLILSDVRAGTVTLAWDYDPPLPAFFEIELRSRPLLRWEPAGVAFANEFTMDLPDASYQARVSAVDTNGIRSAYSNTCHFRVPYVATPPPPTHVKLTIRDAEGRIANIMLDPIAGRAYYRMAPEGPPHVQKSTNLLQWEAFGQGCPPGEYKLESTLITVTQ